MPSRKKKQKAPPPGPRESQAAEVLTIGWSLTVVTLFICDVAVGLTRLAARAEAKPGALTLFSGWLLFSASVIAVISLSILPFVLKLRTEKPPKGFTALAIVVAVAPLLLLVYLLAT